MEDVYTLYKKHGLKPKVIKTFQTMILDHYRAEARSFPWRETTDPYRILVSEVMLQQTQTSRVVDKYRAFTERFPDIRSLAEAPFRDVLALWQGLGYNRRALALQKAAQAVVEKHGGVIPSETDILVNLPGVGAYTAGAVVAITFGKPSVFIDTNIRTIYHYYFFRDEETVSDKDILKIVEATLYRDDPRAWALALFDYGVMLKRLKKDVSAASRKKQSAFAGSDRELRGKIIKYLLKRGTANEADLVTAFPGEEDRIERILVQLEKENLIRRDEGIIGIA